MCVVSGRGGGGGWGTDIYSMYVRECILDHINALANMLFLLRVRQKLLGPSGVHMSLTQCRRLNIQSLICKP